MYIVNSKFSSCFYFWISYLANEIVVFCWCFQALNDFILIKRIEIELHATNSNSLYNYFDHKTEALSLPCAKLNWFHLSNSPNGHMPRYIPNNQNVTKSIPNCSFYYTNQFKKPKWKVGPCEWHCAPWSKLVLITKQSNEKGCSVDLIDNGILIDFFVCVFEALCYSHCPW